MVGMKTAPRFVSNERRSMVLMALDLDQIRAAPRRTARPASARSVILPIGSLHLLISLPVMQIPPLEGALVAPGNRPFEDLGELGSSVLRDDAPLDIDQSQGG